MKNSKTLGHCVTTFLLIILYTSTSLAQDARPRELGVEIGILDPGPLNSITDVAGISVGHVTLIEDESVRTGVTVVLPHQGNVFLQKVPAAIYLGNGFGKLAGYSQVEELGYLETPVALTNTLSVPAVSTGLIEYTLKQPGNEDVRSVNAVVGETNDGFLNDIRGMHVQPDHVTEAISTASTGVVPEGNVGAGTGTRCFGFKGGIGSSSRRLPESLGGFTVGVLVQTNFGGVLKVHGAPVGKELERHVFRNDIENGDGSCMIVVATDAPISARNLKRLAKRAFLGLGNTGGIASNGSGDYVIAFSTSLELREAYDSDEMMTGAPELRNDKMSPLFLAAIEATEEAIINSLFAAESMSGREGNKVDALPVQEVLEILDKYNLREGLR